MPRRRRQNTDNQLDPLLASAGATPPEVHTVLAEAQALSARLAALNEIAASIQASFDIDTVLRTLARETRWLLDYHYCSLAEINGDGYYEHVLHTRPATMHKHSLKHGVVSRALRDGQAVLLKTITDDDEAPPGMGSALIVPLGNRNNMLGSLNFFAEPLDHYTYDDLRIAYALAIQVAVVLQNVRLFQAVSYARDELQTVLESTDDGVLVLGDHGRVVLANAMFGTMLCLPDQPQEGQRVLALAHQAQVAGQLLVPPAALRELVEAARANAAGTIELTDGRHFEWMHRPLCNKHAKRSYVFAVRDVSSQVALTKLRDDMISMLVHDLRTPLTSIIMGLELIELFEPGDVEYEDTMQRTKNAANNLLQRINLLLDVRKLEAGRMDLRYSTADLLQLARSTINAVDLIAVQQQQHVTLDSTSHDIEVHIDAELVQRVVENLLSNALKFTPEHGSITVRIATDTPDVVTIQVQDNGPGVPAAMKARVFDKFDQGGPGRKGTGIGLTFCKMVVEAHGGTIGINDAPGGGSVFWFTLPTSHTDA